MVRAAIGVVLWLLVLLAGPAAAQRRVALVIGNSAYQHVPVLANPGNDARAVAAALGRLGFETDLVLDADRAGMEAAVRRLGDRAAGVDMALFFYAGHAVEVAGRNHLIPVSANIRTARDLPFETLDFDVLLGQVEGRARVALVLLDACRENPFRMQLGAATRGVARAGMAPVQSATGTLIALATAPGNVAQDGTGAHSPFTAALLEHLEVPGLEIRQILARVRRAVREATGGQQVPWETSALEGDVFLRPAEVAARVATPGLTAGGATRGAEPAIGGRFEGRLKLPEGEVPLPPGSWRLVGMDNRTARGASNFRRSNAVLVQERNGRAVAVVRVWLRVATGPRAETWARIACAQGGGLAQRVTLLAGDRMDCVRVSFWGQVAPPEGDGLRDIESLFAEARSQAGWLPPTLLVVSATVADEQRMAGYQLLLDPAGLGVPGEARAAETWSLRRLDAARQACVSALAGWADRLRPVLRSFVSPAATPVAASALSAPGCRAQKP